MILAFLQLLDGELSNALTSISSIPELVTALKRFAPAAAGVLTGTVVMVFVGFAPMEHLTIMVRVVFVLVQAIISGISSWICANSSWRVSVLRGIASGELIQIQTNLSTVRSICVLVHELERIWIFFIHA
jgi:hypothetical protein